MVSIKPSQAEARTLFTNQVSAFPSFSEDLSPSADHIPGKGRHFSGGCQYFYSMLSAPCFNQSVTKQAGENDRAVLQTQLSQSLLGEETGL